jgi:hypothetical protein
MGERIFTKWQYGPEADGVRGTAVAATRILGAAPKEIVPDRTWEEVKLADGSRANANYIRNDQLLVKDTLSIPHGYFQVVPMLGQCSLDGTITPAEQTGSQSDYLWDIAPSLTAANAPDSITLEGGDDVQAYECEYVQFDSLKFAWDIPDDASSSPVSIEAGFYGRQWTPTTFTSSLVLPPGLEFINGKLSRLYLDATWAGIGTTEQTGLLRGGEIEILTGLHPKPMGSANKYFTTHGEGDIAVMGSLTLEGNSSADAIWDLYQAGTKRAMRIDFNGSQIGTGVNYRLRLDTFVYFPVVRPLGAERQGNNIHVALFRSIRDATSLSMFGMSVITNHNTL